MKDHEHSVVIKKVDKPTSTQLSLSLEFEGDHVLREEKRAAQRISENVKIPGFRSGKVPLDLMRTKYKEQIRKEMVSRLLERGLNEALEEIKLVPINEPEVSFEDGPALDGKPFGFIAKFEIQPEIELRHYKNIPLKAVKAEVTDEEN